MKASRIIVREVESFRSQFFQSLRHFKPCKMLSITHILGVTAKV